MSARIMLAAVRGAEARGSLARMRTVAAKVKQRLRGLRHRAQAAKVIGRHDRTPSGELRDASYWREPIVRATRILTRDWSATRRHRRRPLRLARRNGYAFGEHCLGGAYAAAGELVDELGDRGWVDDELAWCGGLDLGEDIVLGLMRRAAGRRMANSDVFGARFVGLPSDPETLATSGFAIVHSVKNHPGWDEADIRAFFRSRRQDRVS